MVAATEVRGFRAALDDLWALLEEAFGGLSDADWRVRHGKDWTIADVPYHLAYFDEEMVAESLEQSGAGGMRRPLLATSNALDEWNAACFARRPSGQPVQQSLQRMRAARERIRGLVESFGDEDLEEPLWMPLVVGDTTVRVGLAGAVMHNWSEYMQLPIRLKRELRLPAPSTTHLALDGFMHFFPMTLNRERSRQLTAPFIVGFDFIGPGGGAWRIRATEGTATVTEDGAVRPDVGMTMRVQTFPKLWNEMQNPMLMMATRQIRVRGFRKMGEFQRLFPQPKPDTPLDGTLVRF